MADTDNPILGDAEHAIVSNVPPLKSADDHV